MIIVNGFVCDAVDVEDDTEVGSESSDGQRLNDSQRATSLAGRTAHEAERMLKMMEIKHKYKLVLFSVGREVLVVEFNCIQLVLYDCFLLPVFHSYQ